MKYKDPITGELKDIIIKSGDTLPIGTIVDFDGDTIPDGYEEATEASDVVNSLEGNEIYRAPSVKVVNEVLNGSKSMGSIVVEDIECKNLFKTPNFSETKNGVTLSCEKGLFRLNGTATATTTFFITNHFDMNYLNSKWLNKTITTSIQNIKNATDGFELNFASSSSTYYYQIKSNTISNTKLISNEITAIMIVIGNGSTWNNATFNVQSEKGTVATDYVEHKEFSNKQIYSTSEQVIGVWIDGKTLYRKVITSTTMANNYNLGVTTVDTIVHIKGMVQRKTNLNSWQLISSRNDDTVKLDISTVNTQTGAIDMLYGSYWTSETFNKIILIVEYTKTTD